MNISTLAGLSGVPAKTVRYYESVGLIPPAIRTANGYRFYDDADVQTLQFRQRARGLGFPVEDVANLLALWRDQSRTSADVKSLALRHVDGVERKIRELETILHTLLDLIERCHGDDRPSCPILSDLAGTAGGHERSGQDGAPGETAERDSARIRPLAETT